MTRYYRLDRTGKGVNGLTINERIRWFRKDHLRISENNALVCDEDNSASLYTKNGGYFGIFPYEEINVKDSYFFFMVNPPCRFGPF